MQLFTRTVSTRGPQAEVTAAAIASRDYVSKTTGREVALWAVTFGAPLGTFTYATRVEGLADVQAMTDKLAGDKKFLELSGKFREFAIAPPMDSLSMPLHGELGEPPAVGCVATVTSAIIAAGAYSEALAWGVDMAIHVEKVTDMPVLFTMDQFGEFGAVTWVGVAPNAAAADTAGQILNADHAYMEKLGATGTLFNPGSGRRLFGIRIA